MANLSLAEHDGGHYDEDAFFDNVEDSGAILDWWVTTDAWRSLLTKLRSIDFDSQYEREGVLTLMKKTEKDLPADVNARFPANFRDKRLTFYRLGDNAKQHINHLLLAASRKFGNDETRNRARNQKVPSEASDKDFGSCSSSCAASWVNPTRSFQEATASYFMHLSSLDSEKPQIYNRKKFEDEFSLVWMPRTTETAIGVASTPAPTIQADPEPAYVRSRNCLCSGFRV
ncbi:uncharacterized protein [Aristolochia californica]|uniref:uncharacterized protein n=1 Tax=Aristolochia californica TaxID=171875 RepID=UPI0035E14D82